MSLRNLAAELVDRVRSDLKATAILAEWLGDGGIPVTPQDAERRASVCVSCKFNRPRTTKIENSIAEAIRRHDGLRNQVHLRTGKDTQLHNCEVCKCYLKLKVWVPLQHLNDDTMPDHCWVTKERPKPRPIVRIRREDAFGDVIQASILATKMWELGYDVHWRCSDATRPALTGHPHISRFITDKTEHVDVNLDNTYEENMERKNKDLATLFIEASEHQLKRGGFPVPVKHNLIPFLKVTYNELEEMKKRLDGVPRPWISMVQRSNFWPSRTVNIKSIIDSSDSIIGSVIWASQGESPYIGIHGVKLKTFRELMALIAVSDIIVTPDTGPLHVAAAFNKPIVLLEQSIPGALRLSDQTDWTAVHAPLTCIRCGDFTCGIDKEHPPCQDIPAELIANAVNQKIETMSNPSVSVIIPVHKITNRLSRCINSIFKQVDEVIVSLDGDAKLGPQEFNVIPSTGTRTGFGATCMRGARQSIGKYLLFLNDDCYLNQDAVLHMVSSIEKRNVAVVGAQLWYPDGTLQHGGTTRYEGDIGFGHIDCKKRTPTLRGEHDMEFVTFAAALVRRDVFYSVRGFDEEYDCYNDDSDLCLKIKEAGYRVVYNSNAIGIHDESQTTGPIKAKLASYGDAIFRRKWSPYFQKHPIQAANK